MNHKRVERIWRREGLKVPKKQPKRGRLWMNDGSCVRLRPTHKDHVWSYDFVILVRDDRVLIFINLAGDRHHPELKQEAEAHAAILSQDKIGEVR